MGLWLSKRESLEFAVLPSSEISGPLGLGDPDSTELTKVEKDTMIPALMMEELRTKKCVELWDSRFPLIPVRCPLSSPTAWNACQQEYQWSAVLLCRNLFHEALTCNKKFLKDPEYFEVMKQRYLKMRADYRRTGVEQKIVRTES
ncbi:hypothetical protein FGIG_11080 [Fasciola gigantica]|uniref:COX assembly mitochondrial protein n=1 Tax=Fasciola gigantica TaxID=46835 RepID=A0A504Z4W9_FASGI|nr:hypothetical protein FGIG_11080 [Fasciola gigantica]